MNAFPRNISFLAAGTLAAALVTLTGCGIGSTAGSSPDPVQLKSLQGNVHGGMQPISGAVIQLWSVGSSGYGSDGTNLLGSHVVQTDSNGFFDITGDYTCPTNDTLVYITATGGNPGMAAGTNNTAIKLASALGTCGNLITNKPYIWINEVTTAAAAFALGQFFTPTFGAASSDNFGSANTTQSKQGLANAFATFANLVDPTNGQARAAFTITGSVGTVTATPEAAKLNTIADILASCVNSDGGGTSTCQTTLFPSVVSLGGTQPTDTLQAAVYMSLNPTSANTNSSTNNLTALYGLQTATPPYSGLSSQPTDWTLGINFLSSVAAGQPQNIAVDATGNVWVQTVTTGLLELSPGGSPLANPLNSSTSGSGTNGAGPRNLAVDTAGNVWVTTSSSSALVYKYLPASNTFSSYATSKSSYGLAIDGSNNVFVGSASTSSHYELFEFPGADITKPIQFPLASSTPGTAGTDGHNDFVLPQYMAFDTFGNLWMSNGSASSGSSSNAVVQLSNIDSSSCTSGTTFPCAVTTSTTKNTYTQINAGSPAAPFGLAANTNSMWYANSTSGSNTVTDLSLTGSTVNSGTAYGSGTSISSPRFLAVDGSGNVWVSDKNSNPGSLSELSSTGAILSPVNSGSAPFNVIGFNHAGLASGNGVAIDPSGNVWVPNNATSGTSANSIFELVGAASPTVTPIASALAANAVAKRP